MVPLRLLLPQASSLSFASLSSFVNALLDSRHIDPRDVGVDWILFLVNNGKLEDATNLQEGIEIQRRKQYHCKMSDPQASHTKKLFQAYSGLVCYCYAKKLRSTGLGTKAVTELETIFEEEDVEYKTSCEEQLELEQTRQQRENLAEQFEDKGGLCFEEAIFVKGGFQEQGMILLTLQ
jgi:hypothetical protein